MIFQNEIHVPIMKCIFHNAELFNKEIDNLDAIHSMPKSCLITIFKKKFYFFLILLKN